MHIIDTFLIIYLLNFLIVKSKNSSLNHLSLYCTSQLTTGFFKITKITLIFIIFSFYLFMFIEIKLTFKSVSLVRIKNYLSIFNKNMENIFLGIGGIYKVIYFFNIFIILVRHEK